MRYVSAIVASLVGLCGTAGAQERAEPRDEPAESPESTPPEDETPRPWMVRVQTIECKEYIDGGWEAAGPCSAISQSPSPRPPMVIATGAASVRAVEPPSQEPAESNDEVSDLPCLFVGRPGCGTQPTIELGMGWGESTSYVGTQWSYHAYAEVGMLVGLSRDFQLGPVAEIGGDTGRVTSGYTFSPKIKARYWIGGWYISLDGALGAAFEQFTFDGGTENGTRSGLTADLGFTVLGVAGPYAALYELGDPGGHDSSETRWIVGIRGNLLGWGAVLAAVSEGLDGVYW